MKSIFIDSDVFLDVLARREPFYIDSAKLLSLAEKKSLLYNLAVVVTGRGIAIYSRVLIGYTTSSRMDVFFPGHGNSPR